MKITIQVPEMKCAKCDATDAIQPVFLYVKGIVPPQFREMLTSVVKERADVHAVDDSGHTWEAFADDKPAGWTKGPGQVDLCGNCSAMWIEAGKEFLSPPAKAPDSGTLKPAPATASPAKEQAARPPTMSEILAAKNYDGHASNNSMMPMVPPTRR